MEDNGRKIYTVSQIGSFVKGILESNPLLKSISIKGEISNFVHHKAGHLYFDLKDEGAVINSVMFAGSVKYLKFPPKNGMRVVATGRVTSYEKGSRYQIIVSALEPDGVGALHLAYEELKAQLHAEGLFDPSHKRPLPRIPTRVGVVTSPTGAAIRDILNVSGRRFPYAKIVLYPALVQGDGAAASIIEGIRYFNSSKSVDVMIIGRGGGSIEDLWAFNDETLARVIYASEIPIISAVGHEIDFTISDFVADMRAPTPTAAAEIALPDNADLIRRINNITDKMRSLLSAKCAYYRQSLEHLASSRALSSPLNMIDDRRMAVTALCDRMDRNMELMLSRKKGDFVRLTAALDSLNPMSVIKRGYSAVYGEDNTLVKSVDQIKVGSRVNFKLSDGSVSAVAEEIRYE